MSVRAKFYVSRVQGTPEQGAEIVLSAVYDSDPSSENGQFFRNTPSGQINMGIVNPAAAAQFVEGTEMFVDFTPVPKDSN